MTIYNIELNDEEMELLAAISLLGTVVVTNKPFVECIETIENIHQREMVARAALLILDKMGKFNEMIGKLSSMTKEG